MPRSRWKDVVFVVVAAYVAGRAYSDVVAGDVNLDEAVNAIDVQVSINAALSLPVGGTYPDIDLSGAVNAIDVQLCINAALGIVIDRDGDGLCDGGETNVSTNPDWYDTDADASYDGEEIILETNPLDVYDYFVEDLLHVDASNTSGSENGSCASPYRTIAAAIAAATPYDEIRVCSGVYEERVVLTPHLRLTGEHAAYRTTIHAPGKQGTAALTLAHHCVVRGFTVSESAGAALSVPAGTSVTVSNCVLHTSESGLFASNGSAVAFVNNTLYGNDYGIYAETSARFRNFSNCVFMENGLARSATGAQLQRGGYNLFFGNTANTSGSSLFSSDTLNDPRFIDVAQLNFHLDAASLARDAGDPAALENDLDGSRNDQGADGGPFGIVDVDLPTAVIALTPDSGGVPLLVNFNGALSHDDWGIVSYSWDMDAADGIQNDSSNSSTTHEYAVPGVYTVTLTVADNSGLSASATARVVAGPNHAPVLRPIGNQQVTEGVLLEFTVSASDPDAGDSLTYSAANLPSGATFNPSTRTFAWTPSLTAAGTYPDIRFAVTDNGTPPLSDSENITITVGERNRPPELAYIPDQQVNEGGTLQFLVQATDPDAGDTLTFSTQNLPRGATFNRITHLFSWVPTMDMIGTIQGIQFIVTDNGAPPMSDSQAITITVREGSWPVASAEVAPIAGPAPLNVAFTGEGYDPDGGDVVLLWQFGDGASSHGLNPSHIFEAGTPLGSYRSSLSVRDDENKTAIAYTYLTITAAEVLAARFIDPETGGAVSVNIESHPLDGVSVSIPAWCTTEPFVATIGDMSATPPAALINMRYTIELGPEGIVLDQPATVTVPLPKALHPSQAVNAVWYDEEAATWSSEGISNPRYVETPYPAVLFETSHFSVFAVTVTRPVWDIGTMGGPKAYAFALTELRDVAGYSYMFVSTNERHAFLWNAADGYLDLGTLTGKHSFAFDINALGQVAGYYELEGSYATRPFIWDETNGMRDIGTFGGSYTYAYGLNDSGAVVGSSMLPNWTRRAFLWTESGGMEALGTLGGAESFALDINAAGHVAGGAQNAAGETHVFLWDETNGMQDLGTLGGTSAFAQALNAAGLVVGASQIASGDTHAFVWDETNGMRDLGAFDGFTSSSLGLNNAGQIVGQAGVEIDAVTEEELSRAFLWQDIGGSIVMQDLNEYVAPNYPFVLAEAWDINENGDIVGTMRGEKNAFHAFLLGNE